MKAGIKFPPDKLVLVQKRHGDGQMGAESRRDEMMTVDYLFLCLQDRKLANVPPVRNT